MQVIILTATDEDGTVLDTVELTPEEFAESQVKASAALGIMQDLAIGL